MILRLAWSSLRRHSTRTLLAMLGVAVATAMLLDMVMMSSGLRESFRELLLSRGFQLRLAPRGTLPFDTDATIENASGIIARLRTNPDVGTISPVLGATIHVPVNGRVVTSSSLGVDPRVQGDYELLSGKDPMAADEIVVNDDFIRETGAKVGDTIEVSTGYNPQLRTYSGTRRLVITGRARFIYGASNQLATAMQISTLQEMGGQSRRDDASLFMIKVRDDARVESVREWAEREIPDVSALSIETALA